MTKSHTLSIDEPGDATTQPWAAPSPPESLAEVPVEASGGRGRWAARRGLAATALAVATAASLAVVLVARHGSRPVARDEAAAVAPAPRRIDASGVDAAGGAVTRAGRWRSRPLRRRSTRPTARRRIQRIAKKPARTPAERWDPEAAVLPH